MINQHSNTPFDERMTTRLILRRPVIDDELVLCTLWRSQMVRQFLGGIVSENLINEKLSAIDTHWNEHGFGQWTVCKKNPAQESGLHHAQVIIGLCGLHHAEDGIELSYMFLPEFWGMGFAEEAAKAALDYGLNTLKLKEIIAITQEDNNRSCQLLEKIGMHHTKTFSRYNATQRLYSIRK